MERISITPGGTVYTVLTVKCQCCDNPATSIITPYWAPDFHVCERCKPGIILQYLSHLPNFTNK